MANQRVPDDPLKFIKERLQARQILWTYHVNMRLSERAITREEILQSIETFEIIEAYLEDKYLPSYLLYGSIGSKVFHVQVAVDVSGRNVRVITGYIPDPAKWDTSFKRRR